jgi:AAA+ ATPase superfamily predicted ATPase
MMQGLVFDRAAPLFGRADEILRIVPLSCRWIGRALGIRDPIRAVEAYAVWGGVPRYWELAAAFRSQDAAVAELVLSPQGVLRDEPAGLLLDDLRDTTQAASILALVGAGCHRLSEIAARLGKPATSLTRPVQRLVELDLVRREVPLGSSVRDTKRTSYRIADPFLRFWFRFVEPARSRIDAGMTRAVASQVSSSFGHHAGSIWEDLVRAAVPRMAIGAVEWTDVGRWWGTGLDGKPMEIDVVGSASDGRTVLVAEAEWSDRSEPKRLLSEIARKAANLPLAKGRKVIPALFVKKTQSRGHDSHIYGPRQVLEALP